jgi:hypothetical protein
VGSPLLLALSSLLVAASPLFSQAVTLGKVAGASHVHVRSGPDQTYPSVSILKEGDRVWVQRAEKSWYFVIGDNGAKGYIHQSLVRVAKQDEPIKTAEVKEHSAVLEVEDDPEPAATAPAPQQVALATRRKGQPLPLIKVIEGREWEIFRWIAIALGIFVVGWICGGNYYLRRDRINRSKLRL